MSQESSASVARDTVVADGPGAGVAGSTSDSDLEGGGWVVVTESTAQEARGTVEAEAEAEAEDAAEAEACLKLKKKVWLARICQRKSAKKIAEAEDLDERTVEAYAAEVEALRNQLGLQWTWFEEELKTGVYDDRLRRRPKSWGGGSAAPEPGDASAFPSLASMLGASVKAAGQGKKGSQRPSPASSAKSTPKLKPKLAPPLSPTLAPAKESWSERPMPPPEVWLAAKEHRKTNFFAAAVLGEAKNGNLMLLSILRCVEASGAIDLGLSSRGFASALLADGAATELWQILGSGSGRMLQGAGASREGIAVPTFAGDPAFRLQSWARQRAFASRVAGGAARPALLTPTLPELAFPDVELGPFLPRVAGCGSLGDAAPDRLLVCDGRQTFHVVDVSQRSTEGVQVDRFHSRILRSSLGAHPISLTASWPAGPQARSAAANGVVVARPRATRGVAAREAVAAFQWLELPEFEAGGGEPSEAPAQATAATTAAKPSSSSPATPELQPSAAPAPAPAAAAAAKPKPAAKSLQTPGKAKPQASTSAGSSLIRASVPQERVTAALAGGAPGGAGAVEVETVWPLPGHRVLILVHDTSGTPPLGPAHSPALGPARSPGSGPARSPGLGPEGSPSISPPVSAGTSPQVGPRPATRRQDGGLTTLELPGSACQASSRGEEAPPHGEYHLQVWEAPSSTSEAHGKASLDLLASVHVPARVTCIHVAASPGDSKPLLLCGFAHGGAELRELPLGGPPVVLQRWPSVEVSGGAATKVLLRGCRGGRAGSAATEAAIVAQAGSVALYDARPDAPRDPARVLPVEGFEASPRVSGLQPVGAHGFAVCGDAYVYAFAVSAGVAGPPAAELLAAVRLPVLEGPREGPEGPAVRHFHATPYEFLAVLEETAAADPEQNALCGLWPEDGLQVSTGGSTATRASAGGAGDDSEHEEGDVPRKKASYVQLRAWARKGGGFLKQLELPAVVLNRTLFPEKGASPSISSVALLVPETADEGVLRSCPWGRGYLAAAAPGVGVAVFRWGVEASPELERYRELRRKQAADEARQREREGMRRQLQRLQQRLQETDRLEERMRTNGPETLTEEEHAKLQRRLQVERECERLSHELGLDASEGSEHSEDENGEGGQDTQANFQAVAMQRRREKERQQKEHHVHKRDLQKERRMNRDRKFVED